MTLFKWFSDWIGRLQCRTLNGPPADVLRAAGVPVELYPWLSDIADAEYPLKETPQGPVPDLERRHRTCRRGSGQYYTPESLVRALLAETGLGASSGAVLDPACGDGAFLVPLAQIRVRGGLPLPLSGLCGTDLDVEALLICLARLLAVSPRGGVPSLERRDFLLAPPAGPFSLVLGNPPYRVNLPAQIREELGKRYSTVEGEKDLYTFFIEGGLRLLEPGGTLLLLTSHTWLVNHQCVRLRQHVFGGYAVRRLFLLPARFFPQAPGVIPVVTEVCREPGNDTPVCVYDTYVDSQGWLEKRSAPADSFLEPTGLRLALADPARLKIFDRMESGTARLGGIARVGVGIQESLRREGRVSRFVSDGPAGASPVKVLRGREVEPFRIRWDGLYLDYGPHLTYAGDPEVFRGEKILYQNLRHETLPVRIVAALDRNGFFPKNSISYIARPQSPFTLEYIAGLLNSLVVNAWFAGRYFSFHVTVTQMRSVPIPEADSARRRAVEAISRRLEGIPPGEPLPAQMFRELSLAAAACYFPEDDPELLLRQLLS